MQTVLQELAVRYISSSDEVAQSKAALERAFGRYWISKVAKNDLANKALKRFLSESQQTA